MVLSNSSSMVTFSFKTLKKVMNLLLSQDNVKDKIIKEQQTQIDSLKDKVKVFSSISPVSDGYDNAFFSLLSFIKITPISFYRCILSN